MKEFLIFRTDRVGDFILSCILIKSIKRNKPIRVLRDNIVIFEGELDSLKRFKDDVKEVSKGYDCGLQVKDYKDLKIGDQIEAFINVAIKKKI